MDYTLDDLLHQTSIIEIAEHYGYQFQRDKGRKTPIYKNGNGDKIGVFNPDDPPSQRYFNLNDSSDKGSLYFFIRNRLANGIIPNPLPYSGLRSEGDSVIAVLRQYLNLPVELRNRNRVTQSTFTKQEMATPDFTSLISDRLEHREFLHNRGFSDHIIDLPLWGGRIFNIKEYPYTVAFPLWAQDAISFKEKVVGIEGRNKDFKQFLRGTDKARGIWHSNIPDKIRYVFVAESPLDCLAHRQLKGSDDTFYISFGGTLCQGQIESINSLLKINGGRIDRTSFQYLLGADNDRAGLGFCFSILSDYLFRHNVRTKTYVHPSGKVQCIEFVVGSREVYRQFSRLESMVTGGVGVSSIPDRQTLYIEYPMDDVCSLRSLCVALTKMPLLSCFMMEQAVLKDWNDDLKALKRINSQGTSKQLTYTQFSEDKSKFLPLAILSDLVSDEINNREGQDIVISPSETSSTLAESDNLAWMDNLFYVATPDEESAVPLDEENPASPSADEEHVAFRKPFSKERLAEAISRGEAIPSRFTAHMDKSDDEDKQSRHSTPSTSIPNQPSVDSDGIMVYESKFNKE